MASSQWSDYGAPLLSPETCGDFGEHLVGTRISQMKKLGNQRVNHLSDR